MKKILLGATALVAIGITAPASAADLGPQSYKAAPLPYVAPIYNWTGLYAGINGGYGWGTADHTAGIGFATSAPAFSSIGGPPNFVASHDLSGGVFGGHIGYNWQASSWVFGLEASAQWTDVKGSTSLVPSTFGAAALTTYSSRVQWLATATPRLGFAVNNWLFYVKGGLAAGEAEYTVSRDGGGFAGAVLSGTQQRVGWTAGGGIEWAYTPNWVFGIEGNYIDLGSQAYSGIGIANTGANVYFTEALKLRFGEVLGRISYKF
jgi:outer membrane immunogenic protein